MSRSQEIQRIDLGHGELVRLYPRSSGGYETLNGSPISAKLQDAIVSKGGYLVGNRVFTWYKGKPYLYCRYLSQD